MQIIFTKTEGVYSFTDALYLPDDQTFTDEEIEAMKQERFTNWLAVVNPPETIVTTADPIITPDISFENQ